MKRLLSHTTVAVVSAALVALFLSAQPIVMSQDDDFPDLSFKMPDQAEMAKLMERWQATMNPSKWHRLFERMLGDWTTTTKIYMQGPDGPSMESKGTATYKWRVKGKWMEFRSSGTMMGMPDEGYGVMGYDNFKQKYVANYHSSLGTNMLYSEGTLNKDATELLMWGPMDEPATGQTDKTVGYKYRFVNPDQFIFEIHDLHIGDKTRVIEMVYDRKK